MARPRPALLLSLVGAVAGAAAFLAAPEARAEKPKNHVVFEARVEPPSLGPDGKGTLVLVGKIEPKVHVYADRRFQVVPSASPGVAYGERETTKAQAWTNPYLPDEGPEKVWFDRVEVRIPFTVAPDAPVPAKVGAALRWECCDDDQCFEPEKQTLQATVARPQVAQPPAVGAGGPDGPAVPAASAVVPAVLAAPGGPPAAAPVAAAPALPAGGFVLHLPTPDAKPITTTLQDDETVLVTATAGDGKVSVHVDPKGAFHAYLGIEDGKGQNIVVSASDGEGLAWGRVVEPFVGTTEIRDPVTFTAPYTLAEPKRASGRVKVTWAVCEDDGKCRNPESRTVVLRIGDPAAFATASASPTPPEPGSASSSGGAARVLDSGERGLLFPVVGERVKNWVEKLWESLGILILGPLFATGLALAFTPCVLPLIPITVSIIGGGRADLPKSRLTVLLSSYVLGLSTAFGTLGLVAALSGASISAAFESKPFLWSMASLFALLSFGMFGVYELQPPAWLQRVQGQRKGGSIPAAFLFGALAAVIASPCTGPVIAAMLVIAAQAGNAVVGFLMFFTLGLGMGAVLFAAGALNFVMRPGPWMVWVRYVFGVLLVAIALYYLANSRLISTTATYAIGFAIGALVAVGIARHLVKKEGEARGPATARGVKVAALVVVATVVVALVTGTSAQAEPWITLRDRAHLVAEVEKSKADSRAVVVDTTADWCTYCHAWDEMIWKDPVLREAFKKMTRLQIDVTDDKRMDLRSGVGAPDQQPYFVFLDAKGHILQNLNLEGRPDRDKLVAALREVGVLEGE